MRLGAQARQYRGCQNNARDAHYCRHQHTEIHHVRRRFGRTFVVFFPDTACDRRGGADAQTDSYRVGQCQYRFGQTDDRDRFCVPSFDTKKVSTIAKTASIDISRIIGIARTIKAATMDP